ncbi:MAG: M81 family metallopeptidase [Pseudomonadota bacterium]
MRVLIAMMKHETNTFSPIETDLARFRAWGLQEGEDVVTAYRGTNHPLAAFLDAADAAGFEIVTPIAGEAMPSGIVRFAAYDYFERAILSALNNGPFDAAFLDLHGAMVAEDKDGAAVDGEAALVAAIKRAQPGIKICLTCDMHGNIDPEMIGHLTVFNGYKIYPHTDMYESGKSAADVMIRALKGEVAPVISFGMVPVLAQTLRMGTDDYPMGPLQHMTRELEARPGILAATVFGGFPMADIAHAGVSAIVVADGDQALADMARNKLLDFAWENREEFVYQHVPITAQLDQARSLADDGPIILLDHADNVGSGGTSDVMGVIKAVLDAGLNDVAVAAVWDPDAVQKMVAVGPGAELTLDLGGRTNMPSLSEVGAPLRLTGIVRTLTDGRWTVRGPMYTGSEVSTGPTAVLQVGTMRIVVTSVHHEPWDAGIFENNGIDPRFCRYLLLKSRIHYRAGFKPIGKHTLTLDGIGVTTSDNSLVRFVRVRRPIYPLDPMDEAARSVS